MSARPRTIFRIWAIVLSVVFAVLFFPNILDEHGAPMSLLYTGMGVGIIWVVFFAVGCLVEWAVREEIKRRDLDRIRNGETGLPRSDTH